MFVTSLGSWCFAFIQKYTIEIEGLFFLYSMEISNSHSENKEKFYLFLKCCFNPQIPMVTLTLFCTRFFFKFYMFCIHTRNLNYKNFLYLIMGVLLLNKRRFFLYVFSYEFRLSELRNSSNTFYHGR